MFRKYSLVILIPIHYTQAHQKCSCRKSNFFLGIYFGSSSNRVGNFSRFSIGRYARCQCKGDLGGDPGDALHWSEKVSEIIRRRAKNEKAGSQEISEPVGSTSLVFFESQRKGDFSRFGSAVG